MSAPADKKRLKRLLFLLLVAVVLGIGGLAYHRLNVPEDERLERMTARQAFELSQKEPQNEAALSTLGHLSLMNNQAGSAASAFREALKVQPGSLRASAGLACSLGLLGEWGRAGQMFTELHASNPKNVYVTFYQGVLMAEAGDNVTAQHLFEATVQLYPKHADGWNRLARTLVALGKRSLALEPATRAADLNPNRVEFAVLVADLTAMEGNRVEGRKLLRDAAKRFPREALPRLALARNLLGDSAAKPDEKAEAEKLLSEAIALTPEWPDPRIELARHYLNGGDAEGALLQLEHIKESAGQNPEVGYLLGQAYQRQGRKAEAAKFLERYKKWTKSRLQGSALVYEAEQRPQDVKAQLLAARYLWNSGSRLAAQRHYSLVLKLAPASSQAQEARTRLGS